MKSRRPVLILLILGIAILIQSARAGSATWRSNPPGSDWNTATSWTPATVPNGPGDTATFAASSRTTVSLSASTEVNGIVFNPGASAFTIEGADSIIILTISGVGLVNNSQVSQSFVVGSDRFGNQKLILFRNGATAGALASFTLNPGVVSQFAGGTVIFLESSQAGSAIFMADGASVQNAQGGVVSFENDSSAAEGTFIVNGGSDRFGDGGVITFSGNANAGNGTFSVYGGAFPDAYGGNILFFDSSTAGNGVFTTNGPLADGAIGSLVQFAGTSTAGDATLIAKASEASVSGGFWFTDSSDGGRARVEIFGNGGLGVAPEHSLPGITIGSLEGDGQVALGSAQLAIGSNSLSTSFSGAISSGSLAKIGSGTLTLNGANNTYTGGTIVSTGTLAVSNKSGSATGTGPVQVDAGTLGGGGIISGAVTVGSGHGTGAGLVPATGTRVQATLTLQSALTFNSDAIYTYTFKARGNKAKTDKVLANGVTINSGASFDLSGQIRGTLTQGTVLPVITNTSTAPIAGTFENLPDGAILNVSGNNLQASYSGGDGNDLTLIVVP